MNVLRKMHRRARGQAGFGMVELIAAMAVMSVGVLALYAMFHTGLTQVRRASTITTAAAIADTRMENFRAVKYETIGLAASDVAAADATYTGASGGAYKAISSPENQSNSTTVVAPCPATPCTDTVPTATVVGADGKNYRVDTYMSWRTITNSSGAPGRDVKLITIIVRDATTLRTYARVSSSFDESTGL